MLIPATISHFLLGDIPEDPFLTTYIIPTILEILEYSSGGTDGWERWIIERK